MEKLFWMINTFLTSFITKSEQFPPLLFTVFYRIDNLCVFLHFIYYSTNLFKFMYNSNRFFMIPNLQVWVSEISFTFGIAKEPIQFNEDFSYNANSQHIVWKHSTKKSVQTNPTDRFKWSMYIHYKSILVISQL